MTINSKEISLDYEEYNSSTTHNTLPKAHITDHSSPNNESRVFINQNYRPEHHRTLDKPTSKGGNRIIKDPLLPRPPNAYSAQSVNVVPSSDNKFSTTRPGSEQFFGSMGTNRHGFQTVNDYDTQTISRSNCIDLTKDSLNINKYPHSPSNPINVHDELKALLEGVVEDEDDVPRSRLRRKPHAVNVDDLSEKLENLNVDEKIAVTSDDEDQMEDDGTVEGINVKLLPHQVEGLEWMIGRELGTGKSGARVPKGGILADDMGLGKTLQSISLILTNPKPIDPRVLLKRKISSEVQKTTLVVAPLALIRQWEAEIKNKLSNSHSLKVCVHHGPQRNKNFEALKKFDVVITTYQILVSEFGSSSQEENGVKTGCFGIHWYRVILDEAHTIKNRKAKATKACYSLRSVYRWCLSGTPMQNNLDELQSLIRFLQIKPFDDLKEWKEQIDYPMNNGRGDLAIKRLRHYLKIFMKRRTKEILKVDGALNPGGKPSKSGDSSTGFKVTERRIETISVVLSPKEREFYDRLEVRSGVNMEKIMSGQVSYASALVLLLRLRQACNHPKLVASKIEKDNDALCSKTGTSNPKTSDLEVDNVADIFNKIDINIRRCEICLSEFDNNTSSESFRCVACEKDLKYIGGLHESQNDDKKQHKQHFLPAKLINLASSIPADPGSEDEELNNDAWLVPETERGPLHLGIAGGLADENAEGGGEWLNSADSVDTDTEINSNIIRRSSDDTENESTSSTSYDRKESESLNDGNFRKHKSHSTCEDLENMITSTKIIQLMKTLKKEIQEHKFIVFSQFTSMFDLIEPILLKKNIKFSRYDGKMRNDMREASLDRLRNDKECRVLLCSLKCGSLGLNLTAATRVVILEPFWNPFMEEQAIDRVHRLTQKTDVVVYKITVANSVEERILTLQEKKRELAQQTIEGGKNNAASKLGMNEIMQLFRRDADHSVVSSLNITEASEANTNGLLGKNRGQRLTGKATFKTGNNTEESAIYGRRW